MMRPIGMIHIKQSSFSSPVPEAESLEKFYFSRRGPHGLPGWREEEEGSELFVANGVIKLGARVAGEQDRDRCAAGAIVT